MKYSLFLLALLLSVTAFSQQTSDTRFKKIFHGPSGNFASSIALTNDSGYFFTGSLYNYSTQLADWYAMKTDSLGYKIWSKIIGGSDDDWCADGISTSDGGYIVVGTSSSFGNGYDVQVVKLDAFGTIVWSRTYGGSGEDGGNSIRQTFDGGYIISGYIEKFGVGSDVMALKIDTVGNVQWSKSYGGPGDESGSCIRQTADSGYIISGSTRSFITTGFNDMFMIKLDSNGDLSWSKSYDPSIEDDIGSAKPLSDGGFILCGSVVGSSGLYVGYVIKTDANGNIRWSKSYTIPGDTYFTDISLLSDSEYAICGIVQGNYEDAMICKIDSSGSFKWGYNFGIFNSDYLTKVEPSFDSGIIAIGETDSLPSSRDFYMIKTDRDGKTDCYYFYSNLWQDTITTVTTTAPFTSNTAATEHSAHPTVQTANGALTEHIVCLTDIDEISNIDFQIYPNPCNGKFKIECKEKSELIKIFNSVGQLIFSSRLNLGINEIDIPDATNGIYFIQIEYSENTFSYKLLVSGFEH